MSADVFVVAVEGLSATRGNIEAMPAKVKQAAFRAIDKATQMTLTESRHRVRDQIAFPASYLSSADSSGRGRLGITRPATADRPEAIITGRFRATSLARFSTGTLVPGKRNQNVRLQVSPGATRGNRRMFPIRLRAGNAPIETKFNLGLAIRLREGETIQNKKRVLQIAKNLYLLYGPSVDQVFRTVREEVGPEAAEIAEREFLRQLNLDI